MSQRAARDAGEDLRVGQQFKRVDGAALVFEVVGPVASFGQPHVRVRRVDDPTDMRVFARSALNDRHIFRAVDHQTAPPRAGYGHLRLKAS
jgi:hypothetical protein